MARRRNLNYRVAMHVHVHVHVSGLRILLLALQIAYCICLLREDCLSPYTGRSGRPSLSADGHWGARRGDASFQEADVDASGEASLQRRRS